MKNRGRTDEQVGGMRSLEDGAYVSLMGTWPKQLIFLSDRKRYGAFKSYGLLWLFCNCFCRIWERMDTNFKSNNEELKIVASNHNTILLIIVVDLFSDKHIFRLILEFIFSSMLLY